jgi:hypothetical protein
MRVCLRIAWRKIVDGSREDSTSVLKVKELRTTTGDLLSSRTLPKQ